MKKSSLALPAALIVTLGLLILVFGKVLQHPNSYIFSTSEDAVKSYFNFSYYLKYDEGIRHDGINYPYGDHLQYINSHPLYIQILKFIDQHITPIANYGVAIMNLSMIFSLLLAIPFLFLVLRKYGLPPWYSGILAMIILFLSPQLDRLGGHFEMVYAFFIPLYWYLLIRWEEGRRRGLWTTLLLATSLAGGFTSAYIVAFLAVFPLAILLVRLWNRRKSLRAYLPEGLYLLAIAVAPLIIVKGLVSITDWVDDRPDNPWGFFIFHSNVCSIFMPQRSLLREVLSGVVDFRWQWEGRAYVGFPPMLLALGTGLWLLSHLLQRKKLPSRSFKRNNPLDAYLVAGIIILLFAMCFPFKWFRFLPELLPPLKQFRCLGRFSWIFYYIFSVYTGWFIYRYYRLFRMRKHGITAMLILGLLLGYWALEAGINYRSSSKRLFNTNTLVTMHGGEMEEAFRESGTKAENFQAILFLPFANTCGDKLLFTRGMHAFSQGMKCSYQTGIPLIQSFSPRLSFSHAMSSIQLLADSTIYKTRVDDMDGRDILIVHSGEKLSAAEQSLADRSMPLWKGEHFSLAAMPVEAFNAGYHSWERKARTTARMLEEKGSVRSNADPGQVFYENFEQAPASRRDKAPAAFTGQYARYLREGQIELFNEELFDRMQGQESELSFWLYTDHRTHGMPTPEFWIWEEDGKLRKKIKLESRAVHNVDGLWVRIEHRFTPEKGLRYQLTVRGKYLTVDDLLLRPAGAHVAVMEGKDALLFDNFRLPVDPMN